MSLDGKCIVVTGGSRGLGRAMTEAAARAGASVCMTGVHPERGTATAKALQGEGLDVAYERADVTDDEDLGALAETLKGRWGRVDGLVNNAALAEGVGGHRLEELTTSSWDEMLRVNVRGVWQVLKALLPLLKSADGASVVNLSSDTALYGMPNMLHYIASKGAVVFMTRSLARELGPDGIRVNCIAPGLTRVEATASIPAETHRFIASQRPLQREQQPVDIASAGVFLLSDASRALTGQLIPVNSGFVFN